LPFDTGGGWCCAGWLGVAFRFVLRFINNDRVGSLFNPTIRTVVERVLFEPLAYFDDRKAAGNIVDSVPVSSRKPLGTRCVVHAEMHGRHC